MPCVLIGTKNEADNIDQLLAKIPYDVVIVDDSTDNTPDIARDMGAKVIHGQRRGIARAYLLGLERLKDRRVVQMDAGFTHNPEDIDRLLAVDADLVIGERAFDWRPRALISRAAAFIVNDLVFTESGYLGARFGLNDVTCGFRVWKPELLQSLDFNAVRSKGFGFQVELLVQAYRLKASIASVPIEYKLSNSSFSPWMIGEALWNLVSDLSS